MLKRSRLAKLAGLCALCVLSPADPAWSRTELATPTATFGFFKPGSTVRTAGFGTTFHVGRCRIRNVVISIRNDGRVSWAADVSAREPGGFFPALCTRLIFVDRNNQRLFAFPFICKAGLRPQFVGWRNENLAIPKHLFPLVAGVVRNDRCED
jgi:hypothetical protein